MAMARALRRMVARIVLALAIGSTLALIPLPYSGPIVTARTALVSFLIVVYIGKTIYDTLFYDRYTP